MAAPDSSFDDAAVANPVVQALAKKVELQEDKSFTARYPAEQPVTIRAVCATAATYEGHLRRHQGRAGQAAHRRGPQRKFFELGEACGASRRRSRCSTA
jgi:2-methylcitrate dehydratase PrpD